ncbi:MAG: hypothetical protein AAF753_11695 [Pseudomonadota bacterium]
MRGLPNDQAIHSTDLPSLPSRDLSKITEVPGQARDGNRVLTMFATVLSGRPLLANIIVFIGGATCLFTALGAWSSFAVYQAAAQQQDLPFTLLAVSLIPALIFIGTAFVTYWVYILKSDAIWLSAAMATSPAWPFAVTRMDPSGAFADEAKLGDIGILWLWSVGFLCVAAYMNGLKSKGALRS